MVVEVPRWTNAKMEGCLLHITTRKTGGGGGGSTPELKWWRGAKDFLGFEIHDFGILGDKKIL